jgi:hypothetical protein
MHQRRNAFPIKIRVVILGESEEHGGGSEKARWLARHYFTMSKVWHTDML